MLLWNSMCTIRTYLFIPLMSCPFSFADRSIPKVDNGHSEMDSVIVQIMPPLLSRCFEACVGVRGYE